MNLTNPRSFDFQDHLSYVRDIASDHGPNPDHYVQHLNWYSAIREQTKAEQLSHSKLDKLREAFGDGYSRSTLQGYVYERPLGYAGDFRMIELIYDEHVSEDPRFRKYDLFFQLQQAPLAVRNRKAYFKALVRHHCETKGQEVRVLNLACGPCREMKELLDESPNLPVSFHCLDVDERAVEYATSILQDHAEKVTFEVANVFRFKPKQAFDLVWSAGLFDYFDDKTFYRILDRCLQAVAPGGELAVGNFGIQNPTRSYMEAIAKWNLFHRSDAKLRELAEMAGAVPKDFDVSVRFEPTKVNRFLHVQTRDAAVRVDPPHFDIRGPNFSRSQEEERRG